MGIVTNIFNKGSDRIRLSPDPHLAYCKRIRELGTMSYGDLSPSQQREVDNNLSEVKKSTEEIVKSRFVRPAANTRTDALEKIKEYTSQFINTFEGCEWADDIRDFGIFDPENAVPGFILQDKVTTVSLQQYDSMVHAANSRFGAINLGSAIKQHDGPGREMFGDKAEDKVTLAGQNYNSSVGSFAPSLKIPDPAGVADYYKSTMSFFHDSFGFLDSNGISSLMDGDVCNASIAAEVLRKKGLLTEDDLNDPEKIKKAILLTANELDTLCTKTASDLGLLVLGPVPIAEYKNDGSENQALSSSSGKIETITSAALIRDQKTINDRVSIAKHLLAETQAKLENSDLRVAASSDLFDLSLKLEHNNRKHHVVRCEAPFTNIHTVALDANIEMIEYAKSKELEEIFIELRNSRTLREILSRLKINRA